MCHLLHCCVNCWQCRLLQCSIAVSGSVIYYCASGTVSGSVVCCELSDGVICYCAICAVSGNVWQYNFYCAI